MLQCLNAFDLLQIASDHGFMNVEFVLLWSYGVVWLWSCRDVELWSWGVVDLWSCELRDLGTWGMKSAARGVGRRQQVPFRP